MMQTLARGASLIRLRFESDGARRLTNGNTALARRRDEARELAAELKKKPTPLNAWGLAGIYAALGEKDEAFPWLETAHNLRFSWMPWIKMDPSFLPLRDDPRFQAMARRLTLPN